MEVSKGSAIIPANFEEVKTKTQQPIRPTPADINPHVDIPSNVEEKEVGDKNKAAHESNSNTSLSNVEGNGGNADINPITNTNTEKTKGMVELSKPQGC